MKYMNLYVFINVFFNDLVMVFSVLKFSFFTKVYLKIEK